MAQDNQAITIVYIEDDRASRILVERVLSSRGYDVHVADNGLDGINLVREKDPQLVLTDINLPDMDGREITTRLRGLSNFTNIPIVAITANNSPGSRELALAAGCSGFLTKPIDVGSFPGQVKEFLTGRTETLGIEEKSEHLERHAQILVERLENKIREMEAANKRLRELDSLKSDFIALVSHELRTPLTLISGYAHLLGEQVKMGREQGSIPVGGLEGLATGLTSGISRMQEVIAEIIHVSRISSGTLDLSIGPVRLPHLVESLQRDFADVCAQRQLTLHIADMSHMPLIEADGARLKTAVENVVGNAVKYTPDGGQIVVVGKHLEDADAIDIIVRDTGIGIPRDEQRNIFEQFYVLGAIAHHSTSKSAFQGGGLGIGLAITRGIVEAHRGRIWVESDGRDPEKLPGSAFHIVLPIKHMKISGSS